MKNLTLNINDSIRGIIGSVGNKTKRETEIAFFINGPPQEQVVGPPPSDGSSGGDSFIFGG